MTGLQSNHIPSPPPCPSPPLVLPQGGLGDRHLVNPKRAKPPPKGAVQSIPVVLRSPRGWRGTVFPGVGKDKGGRVPLQYRTALPRLDRSNRFKRCKTAEEVRPTEEHCMALSAAGPGSAGGGSALHVGHCCRSAHRRFKCWRSINRVYGISYSRKLQLLSDARVAIVWNTVFQHALPRSGPVADAHPLLSHSITPQLKSRTIEAAACGAGLLVYDDGWNLMDHYLTPGRDFLYFHNASHLNDLLDALLADPERLLALITHARETVLRKYSLDAWVGAYIPPFAAQVRQGSWKSCLLSLGLVLVL